MNLTYIAAPYRAKSPVRLSQNIHEAKIMAQYYWLRGDAVICPHMNSAFFDGLLPDYQFLKATLKMLSKCDKAVFHPEIIQSEGAYKELLFCREHKIQAKQLTVIEFQDIEKHVKKHIKEFSNG